MTNYYIVNRETGKLELHFEKATYQALSDSDKKEVKSNFLWGRNTGCWISRAKEPHLHFAIRVAESLGLENAGTTGERLSFAEQMERKAERAEHRAERYENRADAAARLAEQLQKPINDMHGDIAFFTQPNINTSAGRAFTRRRERMFASFAQGFKEFNRSEYWRARAATARVTAEQKTLKDVAFLDRRIRERESDIRKLQKSVEEYERYLVCIGNGETPKDKYGWEVKMTREEIEQQIDIWLDRLEAKLDELGFYQDCMEQAGGITYSRENIKPGYIVKVKRFGIGEVVSTGPKNFTFGSSFPLTMQYAEIIEVIEKKEPELRLHPFHVGDEFTCPRWNPKLGNGGGIENATFRIIRVTDKSVTIQTGDEKPFVRKPRMFANVDGKEGWALGVTDMYNGTIYRYVKNA